MMESPHFGHRDDLAKGRRMNWPGLWAVHCQRHMGTETMVILEVAGQHAPQIRLVQHDDLIESLATDAPLINRSTYAFCHGERGALTTSSIPICRTRC